MDLEVAARFWWSAQHFPRDLARTVPSPPWSEVEGNYVGATRAQLAAITRWRQPPGGGRLLLWHGEPGTGKTSAIRTLTGEWRSWAEFQFIADPDAFLSNPGYLLATIAESRGPHSTGPSDRWKVIVLEDAGEVPRS
jgi:hypothetical protein